jgi:hypothetical protein
MDISCILADKKDVVIDKWQELIFKIYPQDIVRFLRYEQDRFANPAGYRILNGIKEIFDKLQNGCKKEEFVSVLDDIIKILALQEMLPSQAVSFIFCLKQVIKESICKEKYYNELLELEDRIDELVKMAFDIFVKYHKKVYELKIKEMRQRIEVYERYR